MFEGLWVDDACGGVHVDERWGFGTGEVGGLEREGCFWRGCSCKVLSD